MKSSRHPKQSAFQVARSWLYGTFSQTSGYMPVPRCPPHSVYIYTYLCLLDLHYHLKLVLVVLLTLNVSEATA